jgi:hypothetical protein
VRTRLTFLDFAVETAFASIPLTLDYKGTVSCRAFVAKLPVSLIDLGSANSQLV